MSQDAIVIDYSLLLLNPQDKTAQDLIHPLFDQAFGSIDYQSKDDDSHATAASPPPLGLIAIKNVPQFYEAKMNFLPQAHTLISLSKDYLEQDLTDGTSLYNAGWSHGKEKLGDLPDISKGSFYFNPLMDIPGTNEDRRKYPFAYPCNKWPKEEYIPQFRDNAMFLGRLMKDVVTLLALHIDSYTTCRLGCTINMGSHIQESIKVKGRLLYYFPLDSTTSSTSSINHDEEGKELQDSWIGWHNDSGFLTALAGDMYIDHDTGIQLPKEQVDPKAGLYVMNRKGTVVQVSIPPDCMAIQIGECMQIVTGGCVVATPHCVRGITSSSGSSHNIPSTRIARISCPCFVDVAPTFSLSTPEHTSPDSVLQRSITGRGIKIPPLEDRWVNNMDFGSFLQKTFELYYNWSKK